MSSPTVEATGHDDRPLIRTIARHPARLAAATVLVATVIRLPTLAFPLTEIHAFRQAQTAFPAVIYAQQGIDLLHPQVPVVGPPWELPFEFPIFQAVGSLLIRAGLPMEVALRSLALVIFMASAVTLWLLLRRNVNERTAFIGLLVFVASPFSLIFSRTVLIEYLAVLGSLVFVYAALAWDEDRRRRWLAIALLGGGVASLVKLSTAVFYLAPVVMTRRSVLVLIGAAAGVAGVLWTAHADSIKQANPYSAIPTSSALAAWNFDGDRLDPTQWLSVLTPTMLTAGMLLTPFALLVILRPERRFWAWMAIALLGPLPLFFNLYAVHDYYSAAITPALAALIAGGLDRVRRPSLALMAVGLAIVTFVATRPYWQAAYSSAGSEHVLVLADLIDRTTNPDDLIVVIGDSWTPAPFLYAHRRGYAIWRGVSPDPPPGLPTFVVGPGGFPVSPGP